MMLFLNLFDGSAAFGEVHFFVALGILLKPSVSSGYLISCPIWNNSPQACVPEK